MKLAWLLLHACCWQAACLTWHPDKNPENQDCLMGFAESPNRVITVRARPLQRKSSNFHCGCDGRLHFEYSRVRSSTLEYARGRSSTLEYARVRSSTHEYARVRSSTFEYARVRTSTHEYARVRSSTLEYARVRSSTHEYARVRSSTLEYARVRTSTLEYARVCSSTLEYGRARSSTLIGRRRRIAKTHWIGEDELRRHIGYAKTHCEDALG